MHKNIGLLVMFQELKTLKKLNGVLLGSNVQKHKLLMIFQELQTLERLNGILLSSNVNTNKPLRVKR
jgi:hypothetical protein